MIGMIPYTGTVEEMEDSPIVISSYSNVPLDYRDMYSKKEMD